MGILRSESFGSQQKGLSRHIFFTLRNQPGWKLSSIGTPPRSSRDKRDFPIFVHNSRDYVTSFHPSLDGAHRRWAIGAMVDKLTKGTGLISNRNLSF